MSEVKKPKVMNDEKGDVKDGREMKEIEVLSAVERLSSLVRRRVLIQHRPRAEEKGL